MARPSVTQPWGLQWGRSAPYRGIRSEIFRWACAAGLRLAGWKITGDWPPQPRAVLVAAPHTSNWDAVLMLAAAGYYRITLRWMGKESLTRGPFGWAVRAVGIVPIDRSARHDVVRAMCETFAANTNLLLAVPPEGTRDLTRTWKSGFYHIAHQAGVPIFLTVLDYSTHTMRMSGVFTTTGDYAADLEAIQLHYRGAEGRHRTKFTAEA
jgi:1-acyl-sn-glycerol-3-phosphate acyltransferase